MINHLRESLRHLAEDNNDLRVRLHSAAATCIGREKTRQGRCLWRSRFDKKRFAVMTLFSVFPSSVEVRRGNPTVDFATVPVQSGRGIQLGKDNCMLFKRLVDSLGECLLLAGIQCDPQEGPVSQTGAAGGAENGPGEPRERKVRTRWRECSFARPCPGCNRDRGAGASPLVSSGPTMPHRRCTYSFAGYCVGKGGTLGD